MNKPLLIALILIILIGGAWYFSAVRKPATGESIKIGVVLPLTGIAAIVGESEKKGMELAVQEINAKGGVDGRPLELVIEDDNTNPKNTVSAIQKLIQVDGVVALVGGTWDFLANAAIPVLDTEKKVLISPSALPDTIEKTSPYFFVTHSPVSLNQEVVSEYLKGIEGDNVVIMSVNNLWGKAHLAAFKGAIKDAGKVLAKEVVVPNFDNNDIQRELSLIKPLNPDAIVIALNFGDSATFLRKKSELEVPGMVLGDFHVDDNFQKGNTEAALLEGVNIFVFSDPRSDFVKKYQEAYGEMPGTYADTAYDAVYVLKEALESADGEMTTGSIVAGLHSISNYSGASGRIDFSEQNYPTNKIPMLKEFNGQAFVEVK